jgi:hypothetical protein
MTPFKGRCWREQLADWLLQSLIRNKSLAPAFGETKPVYEQRAGAAIILSRPARRVCLRSMLLISVNGKADPAARRRGATNCVIDPCRLSLP